MFAECFGFDSSAAGGSAPSSAAALRAAKEEAEWLRRAFERERAARGAAEAALAQERARGAALEQELAAALQAAQEMGEALRAYLTGGGDFATAAAASPSAAAAATPPPRARGVEMGERLKGFAAAWVARLEAMERAGAGAAEGQAGGSGGDAAGCSGSGAGQRQKDQRQQEPEAAVGAPERQAGEPGPLLPPIATTPPAAAAAALRDDPCPSPLVAGGLLTGASADEARPFDALGPSCYRAPGVSGSSNCGGGAGAGGEDEGGDVDAPSLPDPAEAWFGPEPSPCSPRQRVRPRGGAADALRASGPLEAARASLPAKRAVTPSAAMAMAAASGSVSRDSGVFGARARDQGDAARESLTSPLMAARPALAAMRQSVDAAAALRRS